MNEWSTPSGMATIGTSLLMAALMPAMLGLWLRLSRTELVRWVSPDMSQSASQLSAGWAVLASLIGLLIGLLAQSLPTTTPPMALALTLLVSGLMAASRIDLLTQLLPNRITWGLLCVGLAASLLPDWPTTPAASLAGALLGSGLVAFILWAWPRRASQDAPMGRGDLALLAALGAWLGPLAPFAAMGLGALLMLPLVAWGLWRQKWSGQTQLPFGPALCIGGLLTPLLT
jgi:leader peptidase (prepilin peptidase)/N-methyltransferase